VAQGKAVEWLNTLTPERIARMSVADATRLLDVAVRIEREACPAVDVEDLPEPYSEPAREKGSLEQRMIEAGLNVPMSEVANLLHKVLGPPPEPPRFPVPRRQAQADAAPPDPQPGDEQTPDPQPSDEQTPESVWGDRWQPEVGEYGGPR
jgi:hypothetical protein